MGVGTLFTEDFLVEGIKETPVWKDLSEGEVAALRRQDRAGYGGVYLTAELIMWYFRALAAGDPTSTAPVAALLRNAERQVVQ